MARPRPSTSPPTIPTASPRPSACPPPIAPRNRVMLDCIVAEDEVLLRESLLSMLGLHADALRVVADCEDGGAALEAIAEHKPDVAFLDIRMPGLTGLEVAAA